ncbi:MAG TPA: DUF6184 family natural product biosynthesis lipoprotein [Polyangiaceae bacterium]|jgi:hypothetical protein
MLAKKLLCAAFAAFGVAACQASMSASTDVGGPSTTSAQVDASAIEQVTLEATQARCARAYSCGEIGTNGRWADYGTCMSKVRLHVRDNLIGRQCKDGFDPGAAQTCVQAIRDARCEDARDMKSVNACASALRCR